MAAQTLRTLGALLVFVGILAVVFFVQPFREVHEVYTLAPQKPERDNPERLNPETLNPVRVNPVREPEREKEKEKDIYIFWHITCRPGSRCEDVLQRQFKVLTQFGLLDAAKQLFVGLVGDGTTRTLDIIRRHPKTLILNPPILQGNEEVTTCKLKEFADNHTSQDFHLVYFHSRGVTRDPKTTLGLASDDWTHMMEHFVLRRWREAVKFLREGYVTAGCEMWAHEHRVIKGEFSYHYSGNFWWASSQYVRLLRSPVEFGLNDRFLVGEDWVLQIANKSVPLSKFAILHRTGEKYGRGIVHSYEDRYPPYYYASGSEIPDFSLDASYFHGEKS